ncbi:CU044_5270 family protein [Streptomyces sp. NPDC090108]|uniref:CU044_5270 family protein n=1 Tax=Streptomyces sp. NPDC090108 TaxID=3365947 RepID=UPI0037FB6F5C
MDEVTLLREWDTAGQGPSGPARDAARARLAAAVAEESRGDRARVRAPGRRLVLRTAFAGAAAAVVGTTVFVARDPGHGRAPGAPRLESVSATQVLLRAAHRSRGTRRELPVPRDDQYLYSRTYIRRTSLTGGRVRTWDDESWMSVDGSKPSLRQEHGDIHHDPPLGEHEVRWPPTVYAQLEKIPADPDRILAGLLRGMPATDPTAGVMAFTQGCMLMMGPRVTPPGLQAAAFEALAKLPRIRLDRHALDGDGREAVGVSYPGSTFTFLFDRRTYDYLGLRVKGHGLKRVNGEWETAHWYYETRTLREVRVVDRIGQRG